MDALDSLGEDLVLLSVSSADGRVTTAQQLGFGLMGSELVRPAAAGRLTITAGRITVTDASPCQDLALDAALAGLAHATGLGTVLYPGRDGRPARARLERIAKGDEVAMAGPDAGSASGDGDATSQAVAAANQAARAAADAATSAATQAAIDAATSAAVQAATQAAHSAAHSGGGGHGH